MLYGRGPVPGSGLLFWPLRPGGPPLGGAAPPRVGVVVSLSVPRHLHASWCWFGWRGGPPALTRTGGRVVCVIEKRFRGVFRVDEESSLLPVGPCGPSRLFPFFAGLAATYSSTRLSGSTIGAAGFHGRVRDGIGWCDLRYNHQAGKKRKRRGGSLDPTGRERRTPARRIFRSDRERKKNPGAEDL
jgi:hypothetical protein